MCVILINQHQHLNNLRLLETKNLGLEKFLKLNSFDAAVKLSINYLISNEVLKNPLDVELLKEFHCCVKNQLKN